VTRLTPLPPGITGTLAPFAAGADLRKTGAPLREALRAWERAAEAKQAQAERLGTSISYRIAVRYSCIVIRLATLIHRTEAKP
jgi:hypothetical protein